MTLVLNSQRILWRWIRQNYYGNITTYIGLWWLDHLRKVDSSIVHIPWTKQPPCSMTMNLLLQI